MKLKDRAERLVEEAVFRFWLGASVVLGAFVAVRYLLEPPRGQR